MASSSSVPAKEVPPAAGGMPPTPNPKFRPHPALSALHHIPSGTCWHFPRGSELQHGHPVQDEVPLAFFRVTSLQDHVHDLAKPGGAWQEAGCPASAVLTGAPSRALEEHPYIPGWDTHQIWGR